MAREQRQTDQDLQEEFNLRLRESRLRDECESKHQHLHAELINKMMRSIESVVESKVVNFKDATPSDDAFAKFANGVICAVRFHEGHWAEDPRVSFIKVIFSHCLSRENKEFDIQSQIPVIEDRLVCP